jgi:hypothetical protein
MSVVDGEGYAWVLALATPERTAKSWKVQLEPLPKGHAWLPLKVIAAQVAVDDLGDGYGVTRIQVSEKWLDLAQIPRSLRHRHEPLSSSMGWLDSPVTRANVLRALRGSAHPETVDEDQLGLGLVRPKGGGEW